MADDKIVSTGQKISITVTLVGLAAFFYQAAEVLRVHTNWADFQTPGGVGEIFLVFASVVAAVGGAIGINLSGLVRNVMNGGTPQTRSTDSKTDSKTEDK